MFPVCHGVNTISVDVERSALRRSGPNLSPSLHRDGLLLHTAQECRIRRYVAIDRSTEHLICTAVLEKGSTCTYSVAAIARWLRDSEYIRVTVKSDRDLARQYTLTGNLSSHLFREFNSVCSYSFGVKKYIFGYSYCLGAGRNSFVKQLQFSSREE